MVKVSKGQLMKLHNAAYGSGNYTLPVAKKGVDVPVQLTKAQQNQVQRGAKSITLSRKQLNGMKSGGFLPLIPLAIGLISNLFKGKGMEQEGSGLTAHGGITMLLPLLKSIIGLVKGKGVDTPEVEGGFLQVIGNLVKSIFGQGLEGMDEEKKGGFLNELLMEGAPGAIEGYGKYLLGSGKGKKSKK